MVAEGDVIKAKGIQEVNLVFLVAGGENHPVAVLDHVGGEVAEEVDVGGVADIDEEVHFWTMDDGL